jgi:hypothetical protein
MSKFWDKFFELWSRSVIVTGVLTILIVLVIAVLLMTDRAVPDQLWLGFIASISFFFGTKAGTMNQPAK